MSNPWNLTARQAEVLACLAEVGTDTAAAKKLNIKRRTVEHHLALAMAKIGAANRTLLVLAYDRWARAHG
jgi:DNA-binding CsgD family transcriptional regulator